MIQLICYIYFPSVLLLWVNIAYGQRIPSRVKILEDKIIKLEERINILEDKIESINSRTSNSNPNVLTQKEKYKVISNCSASFKHYGKVTKSITYFCDPQEIKGKLYGTFTYTYNSSICKAAAHTGAISVDGGEVTIRGWHGCSRYYSSTLNGIRSKEYGSYYWSFYFQSMTSEPCGSP